MKAGLPTVASQKAENETAKIARKRQASYNRQKYTIDIRPQKCLTGGYLIKRGQTVVDVDALKKDGWTA